MNYQCMNSMNQKGTKRDYDTSKQTVCKIMDLYNQKYRNAQGEPHPAPPLGLKTPKNPVQKGKTTKIPSQPRLAQDQQRHRQQYTKLQREPSTRLALYYI